MHSTVAAHHRIITILGVAVACLLWGGVSGQCANGTPSAGTQGGSQVCPKPPSGETPCYQQGAGTTITYDFSANQRSLCLTADGRVTAITPHASVRRNSLVTFKVVHVNRFLYDVTVEGKCSEDPVDLPGLLKEHLFPSAAKEEKAEGAAETKEALSSGIAKIASQLADSDALASLMEDNAGLTKSQAQGIITAVEQAKNDWGPKGQEASLVSPFLTLKRVGAVETIEELATKLKGMEGQAMRQSARALKELRRALYAKALLDSRQSATDVVYASQLGERIVAKASLYKTLTEQEQETLRTQVRTDAANSLAPVKCEPIKSQDPPDLCKQLQQNSSLILDSRPLFMKNLADRYAELQAAYDLCTEQIEKDYKTGKADLIKGKYERNLDLLADYDGIKAKREAALKDLKASYDVATERYKTIVEMDKPADGGKPSKLQQAFQGSATLYEYVRSESAFETLASVKAEGDSLQITYAITPKGEDPALLAQCSDKVTLRVFGGVRTLVTQGLYASWLTNQNVTTITQDGKQVIIDQGTDGVTFPLGFQLNIYQSRESPWFGVAEPALSIGVASPESPQIIAGGSLIIGQGDRRTVVTVGYALGSVTRLAPGLSIGGTVPEGYTNITSTVFDKDLVVGVTFTGF